MAIIGSADTVVDLRPYGQRRDQDYVVEWYSGTVGAGGQNHQKTQNCARVRHAPTGIVRSAQTRSRKSSMKSAVAAINEELDAMAIAATNAAENHVRREQVGSGQRSDKRRTYRFQDDMVKDHITGKTAPATKIMAGRLDLLW